MSAVNLFEAGAARRTEQEASDGALVSFRAGKCEYDGRVVTPVAAKGKVELVMDEDSILHLRWTNRELNTTVDDLIIFPGDASFSKIEACTTGRVYLLRFSSGRKMLFWMQEPKAEDDEDLFKRANEVLANPSAATGPAADGLGGMDEDSVRSLLTAAATGTATPAQRAQLQRLMMEAQAARAGGAGGPRPPTRTASSGSGGGGGNMDSAFRSALSSALGASGGAAPGAGPGPGADAFAASPFAAGDFGSGEDAELQAAIQASLMEMQPAEAPAADADAEAAPNADNDADDDAPPQDGAVEDADDDEDAELYQS
ncbi:Adrm1b protein [Thecamonas trahens ATCC 50062]|uniref:Adrm1b protein n=1 Tax=Thecamonas trahens ATCC 50062 TaxID=461836 RepID=A0A0L0DTS8_THETB|nr:Adrm1b protein [Thecamonas trahens ATCC 50062]KNC55739.1 Adrm1b protein [Thecamonas trahens ATCC 50062]|eukprot:XP_013752892.1 Adrm1b protein [Thecamonas trahens ATCC 50062]